ncbi:MAG: hypothetical protein RIS35_3651 [Pseudomonadota bacterium]|jgi:hypothetical protein
MNFQGAFIEKLDDSISVLFTTLDETELSDTSNWTEAWENADPNAPAGFIHPGMIIAESARRLLEARPELRQAVEAFRAKGEPLTETRVKALVHTVSTPEDFGLMCLSMWEWLQYRTRVHPTPPTSPLPFPVQDEIPF